jgi:CheY-like chemotaxis protein
MKVLILDDDEISNELSRIILNSMEINDIDIEATASDALQYLDECKREGEFPDLLFVDLNLPGMNGFDFIELYEKIYMQYNPGSRIIMLTNSVVDEDRDEAMRYDSVLDFWSKPLSIPKLKDLLRTIRITT